MKKRLYLSLRLYLLITLLCAALGLLMQAVVIPTRQATEGAAKQVRTLSARQSSAPVPFMHRPYYGSKTILQRTVSFVDHDKPWYVNDGTFVRYDGQKWTNVAIGSCVGGVNCYDGHNGYDLNLWYEPVLSVAAGTVIRAGWYNPLNHQSSLGMWVAVDHGNGYVTAYGHLSAITVYNGEQIGTQWQVGTSGTTGSSTGPHLHMATYYYPSWSATDPFGWSGNYPDPNIVPDNYLWVDNPGTNYSVPLLSANGIAIYPGATWVDDSTSGWSSTGNWNTATSNTDIRGNLHWTATTSGAATATATWQPTIPSDGYYEVGVFVDDNHASSSWAPYTVYSVDPTTGAQVSHTIYVDETHIGSFQGPFGWENTGSQWISLGTYYFKAGTSGRVVLSNATGEDGAQVAADGAEFAPVALQAPPSSNTYGFSINNDGTPSAMLPGSTTTVNLSITNISNFAWNASGSNAVQVVYSWLNTQGQVVASGNRVSLPQNVAINASVSLSVPVTVPAQVGNYTLRWDLTQNGDNFSKHGAQVKDDSVLVARYAESFTPNSTPATLSPGATVQLNVTVQNKGAFTWPASGNAPVTLNYTWLDSSGKPVDPSLLISGSPAALPADVPPGGSVTAPITLHTPVLAGTYKLVYDCQQQGVSFASQGATPLTVTVNITPNLPKLYYFAEGYTGAGTSEYLALTNPSAASNTITITYLFANAPAQTRSYTIAAQSRIILNINQQVGANQTVSMIVQGGQPFVAERTMYIQKGNFTAASDSLGSSQLSSTWYFAEGNTTYGWNTLLAVMNPSSQSATLHVTYLMSIRSRSIATPHSSVYTVPARSRSTFVLNSAIPNAQFGLVVTASTPVLVERPEYLVISPMRGGSSVVGATAPQNSWYFAGGNTTSGAIERLILANPSSAWVTASIHYLTTSGQVITQSVGIPGQSRIEVNVNGAVNSVLHGTVISANAPIIAERQDFYTGANAGSSTVMGATSSADSWYIAQGDTTSGHTQTLAIANPTQSAARVKVVYYSSQGAPIVKTYTLSANTRMTINLSSDVGANKGVGIAIYASIPIVIEESTLFHLNGASGVYASAGYGL